MKKIWLLLFSCCQSSSGGTIFSRSPFLDLPLSPARIVGADTGCKLNKSTFAGDCARAFEIENIRHFRQSQFIRRFRGPPRFLHPIFPASADGRRLRLRGKHGLFERFTIKFMAKFVGFLRMRPLLPLSYAGYKKFITHLRMARARTFN